MLGLLLGFFDSRNLGKIHMMTVVTDITSSRKSPWIARDKP
jgi:hypothetical protein